MVMDDGCFAVDARQAIITGGAADSEKGVLTVEKPLPSQSPPKRSQEGCRAAAAHQGIRKCLYLPSAGRLPVICRPSAAHLPVVCRF